MANKNESTTKHQNNGVPPRLSGYLMNEQDLEWWDGEFKRVLKVDRLPRKTSIGYLFSAIAHANLKLDRRSLEATSQDGEPAELTHKPLKRARAIARAS